jgi:hypothetical protein
MATLDDAVASQIRNIEASTGRSFDEWVAIARGSGLGAHGKVVAYLKADHGLGHGNANLIAIEALRAADAPQGDSLVDAMYAGPKAALRPLHDAVIDVVRGFGGDVELAPKKSYVSVRRSKQFACVGPAAGGTVEVGLNLPGAEPLGRLERTNGMVSHRARIRDQRELDEELLGWLRQAYEQA